LFHANYTESKAVLFRQVLAGHYTPCSKCGVSTCGNAQTLDEDYISCTWGGESCDGTRVDDKIFCSMCY